MLDGSNFEVTLDVSVTYASAAADDDDDDVYQHPDFQVSADADGPA